MTRALRLIESLAREEAALRGQPFLTPLLHYSRARLRVRGLIYAVRIVDARPGWWICRFRDARTAEISSEALPWQRGEYLALWPELRLVLLEPLGKSQPADWIALPYNPSDAAQRFGFDSLVIVRLVEGGQPLDRIIARVEGRTLWYDQPDNRADPAAQEALRAALFEGRDLPDLDGLGHGEILAYELLLAGTPPETVQKIDARTWHVPAPRMREVSQHLTHARLRRALATAGAQLIGYETGPMGLRVTWERDGLRSVTLVAHNLEVVSAGICLSGEDQQFDLTSIVDVMRQAPDYTY